MSREKLLRAAALGLAALWPVGLILAVSSAGPEGNALGIVAMILLLFSYAGGPIVSVLLSRERGEGTGCAWALMAFLFPVVALPIIALRNIQVTRAPQTAQLQAKGDIAALAHALHTLKPPYVAPNAAYALACLGTDQAAQVLVASLRDQQPAVRAAAAGGLGLFGPRALDTLLAAAHDPDPWVREAVARSAGLVGGRQAESALLSLLDDRYPTVRAAATRALAQAGGPAALAPLAASLEDPVPAVRRCAVEALAHVAARGDGGQRAAVESALLNRLQDEDATVQRVAGAILGEPVPAVDAGPVAWPELATALPRPGPAAPAGATVSRSSTSRPPVAPPVAWEAVRAGGERSNLAVVSLVLGIAAWLLLPVLGALGAIVTGHLARRDVRKSEGRLDGSGMALAGLVLGYAQMAGLILVTLALLIAGLLSNAGQRNLAGPTAAPLVTPSDRPVALVVTATPAIPTPWYEATATAQALELQAAAAPTSEAPQAAAQDSLSVAAGWPIVAQDAFDGTSTGVWPLATSRDDLAVITTTIESGRYRLAMDMFQGTHRAIFPNTGTLTDFYLAIDAQQLSGPADATYGIDFRTPDHAHTYYFCLYAGQYYALGRLDDAGWTNLLPGTASPAVQVGGVNRLAILANGPHLTFFINDVVVATLDDATYDSGAIALGIELHQPGDKAVFEFDNMELRAPPVASLPGIGRPAASPEMEITATAAPSAPD